MSEVPETTELNQKNEFDTLQDQFFNFWKEHCTLYCSGSSNIRELIEVFQDYLFLQSQNRCCSKTIEDTLHLLSQVSSIQLIKNSQLLSFSNCLVSFCDLIRKNNDTTSFPRETSSTSSSTSSSSISSLLLSSPALHSLKIYYSLGTCIFFLRLIFEIGKLTNKFITLGTLPKTLQKGVVKCLSIIGFNCANYEMLLSSNIIDASKSVQQIGKKFYTIFPDMICQRRYLNQNVIFNFFHSSYYSSCPHLFEELFDDIDDCSSPPTVTAATAGENTRSEPSSSSILPSFPSFKRTSQNSIPTEEGTRKLLHLSNNTNSRPFPILTSEASTINLSVLSKNNEPNSLLSRSRLSPMNGHRLALERRLLKQQIARHPNIQGTLPSTFPQDLIPSSTHQLNHNLKKRSAGDACSLTNLEKTSRRRRLIIEDTPIRNGTK